MIIDTIKIIMLILFALINALVIAGSIWWIKPYRAMTWFFHGVLGWHKPNDITWSDGCSEHSVCRFCGNDIMQDSQGNWF